jgi:choloylglycine hydrolase
MGEITAFFHVMGTVSTPSGCVMSESGEPVRTVYTSCTDTDSMTYYFTTYENRRVRAVRIRDADSDSLRFFDIGGEEGVLVL